MKFINFILTDKFKYISNIVKKKINFKNLIKFK